MVVVIDNTSVFRYEPDVPLVIPEINATRLKVFEIGTLLPTKLLNDSNASCVKAHL